MWRLTIYQKYKSSYQEKGKEVVFEGEQRISFEAENISHLFNIVDMMANVYPVDETRYEIKKVVD